MPNWRGNFEEPSRTTATTSTETIGLSQGWRNSQDQWDVELLLVEDAQSSQQELPQVFLLHTRVVLIGVGQAGGGSRERSSDNEQATWFSWFSLPRGFAHNTPGEEMGVLGLNYAAEYQGHRRAMDFKTPCLRFRYVTRG